MPSLAQPVSQLCTQSQFEEPAYQRWQQGPPPYHRKRWELAYIAQSLDMHGLLAPGKRGLGFGVGREPLPALFASHNVEVVATDAPAGGVWAASGQYAASLSDIHWIGMCTWDLLQQQTTFRAVDMRAIPPDLRGFDFVWSAGSLEHLGGLQAGIDFIWHSLDCLKPGGLAVHTTEYNLSSNEGTITTGDVVVYRERDIRELAEALQAAGHRIELTLERGAGEHDRYVDKPPYWQSPHLCLELGGYAITSIGLIIQKRSD
jgi:2-polyprenyl-3-methyl-5-hydroxy-6-metoxy-1,4-benzoquinol methylase